MADNLETLTKQYVAAREVADNAPIGPRTDKAQARMEALFVKAEQLGLADALTKALGY